MYRPWLAKVGPSRPKLPSLGLGQSWLANIWERRPKLADPGSGQPWLAMGALCFKSCSSGLQTSIQQTKNVGGFCLALGSGRGLAVVWLSYVARFVA